METEKLYFHQNSRLSVWWWIVQATLLFIFVLQIFVSDKVGILHLVFVICYSLFLLVIYLAVQLNYFRKFIEIKNDALIIKQRALQRPKRIPWSEIKKIDMQLFEPVLHHRNKTVKLGMEHEQLKKVRKILEDKAEEQSIELVE